MKKVLSIVAVLCTIAYVSALENGLALTPPMGWMSWQRFRCIIDCDERPDECISEKLFRRAADRLVSDGYKDAGYEYVIIDDCWMEHKRDPQTGRLVADRKRFPSGIKALADYIHGLGLKFGIYEDYGTHTCAGYPGIIGSMEIDAQTFAEWDVDYVKLDGCYADINDMDTGYPEFGRLLNETGRPMVYSCSWPVYQEEGGKLPDYEALKQHCNLWRNWDDIDDSWESIKYITKYFAEKQDRIQPHGGPGHWNDPDMLLIGNYGLSIAQAQAQMAIWAILAAPLIMSNDLDAVRPEFKEILQNRAIIEINQDRLGVQGLRIHQNRDIEVWTRPVLPQKTRNIPSYAVAFVSHRTDGAPYTVQFNVTDLGMKSRKGYTITDLYDESKQLDLAYPDNEITVRVPPSGVVFYKFSVI